MCPTVKLRSWRFAVYLQDADEEAERDKLREVSKRLYAQLQEAEKKHQEEKEKLQVMYTHRGYNPYLPLFTSSSKEARLSVLFRLKAAGLETVWATRRRSWGSQKKPARRKTSALKSCRGCWEEWSTRAPPWGRPSAAARTNCVSCRRWERKATRGSRGQPLKSHNTNCITELFPHFDMFQPQTSV